MTDVPDAELLERFARENSQAAFAALVERHISLVHSVALRHTASPQHAQDITQAVFIILARKAAALNCKIILPGWLYNTARLTAANFQRAESRRTRREQEAYMQSTLDETDLSRTSETETNALWAEMSPLLDDAMSRLGARDRDALVLRYFQNKSLAEVGATMGLKEQAAQKCVTRAIEKLRKFFIKHGVTLTATAIAGAVSANSIQAAPAGLSATILAATSGITTIVGMTMIHKILITGFAAAAIGSGIYSFHLQKQIAALQQQQTSLNQQITQLGQERDSATDRLTAAQQENEQLQNNQDELLRLRGEIGVLRRQLDEVTEKNPPSEAIVVAMNTNSPAPQIHIKARFLSMPKDISAGWYDSTSAGILTSENLSIALKQLRSRNDIETLAEPEVVTTSGRQVQMRATRIISVVTNFCLQQTNGTASFEPQTENVETGPILDATPWVLPDGHTIELTVIASVVGFLGYAQSTNTTSAYTATKRGVVVPTVSPQFRVQSTTNSVNLFNGQTLVFELNDNQASSATALVALDGSKLNSFDRRTLVFVTADVVDAAGNLVHRDVLSYTNIPPQNAEQ